MAPIPGEDWIDRLGDRVFGLIGPDMWRSAIRWTLGGALVGCLVGIWPGDLEFGEPSPRAEASA